MLDRSVGWIRSLVVLLFKIENNMKFYQVHRSFTIHGTSLRSLLSVLVAVYDISPMEVDAMTCRQNLTEHHVIGLWYLPN